MVKNIILVTLFSFGLTAQAGYIAGVSTHSWQENVPVKVSSVKFDQLTSFTGSGLNIGYDFSLTQRIRYGILFSYLSGNADIHKLDNTVNPRRRFTSYWITNKVHWRTTKTFSFGPSFVFNNRKLEGLDEAVSLGGFLDLDYDLSDSVRLTQSLGTLSNSQQLAYSFTLSLKF